MNTKSKNKNILSDHKRIGKRFIPPMIYKLGDINEVSWAKIGIPEFIWISELYINCGFDKCLELCEFLIVNSRDILGDTKEWFVFISNFSKLKDENKKVLIKRLNEKKILVDLKSGLKRLNYFYPSNPLKFLFSEKPNKIEEEEMILEVFEKDLEKIFDKASKRSIILQSIIFYLLSITGKLKIHSDSELRDFNEINNYPNTSKSRSLASMIRTLSTNILGIQFQSNKSEWSTYFWNRGLEIAKCSTD